jgi:hypothetical protein
VSGLVLSRVRNNRLFCEAILDMYDPGRVRLDAALLELELVLFLPPKLTGLYQMSPEIGNPVVHIRQA